MAVSGTITTKPGDQGLLYIDITQFTRNVEKHDDDHTVTGDGIFDVLMNTATKHLQVQFDAGRIKEENYADMYVQIYQTTLQAALQAWLQKGVAEAQLELLAAQVDAEKAKKALYRRQIEGFDENYKKDILKIMMDSWAVGFSVAKDSFEAAGIPSTMQKVSIDDVFNKFILPDLDKYDYGRKWILSEENQ